MTATQAALAKKGARFSRSNCGGRLAWPSVSIRAKARLNGVGVAYGRWRAAGDSKGILITTKPRWHAGFGFPSTNESLEELRYAHFPTQQRLCHDLDTVETGNKRE